MIKELTMSLALLQPISSPVIYDYRDEIPSTKTLVTSATTIKGYQEENKDDFDNVYDAYTYLMYIYNQEKNYNISPVKLLALPYYVDYPQTVFLSSSSISTMSYSVITSLSVTLSKSVEASAGVNFGIVSGKIVTGLGKSLTGTLSYSFTYETSTISTTGTQIYVDGVNNKFGVYAMAYCAVNCSRYYVQLCQQKVANYYSNNPTILDVTYTDSQIAIPSYENSYLVKTFYFENLDEYSNWVSEWGL